MALLLALELVFGLTCSTREHSRQLRDRCTLMSAILAKHLHRRLVAHHILFNSSFASLGRNTGHNRPRKSADCLLARLLRDQLLDGRAAASLLTRTVVLRVQRVLLLVGEQVEC